MTSTTADPSAIPSTAPSSSAHDPFRALTHATDNKFHLLLACTGSVATIKLPLIASTLHKHHNSKLSIHILLTASARKFLPTPLEIPGVEKIWTDDEEWSFPQNVSGIWERGDPVLHIELRRWADLLVIAPLSANSLAKMVGGMCDNLLLSVVRAWDAAEPADGRRGKRIVVAPAMNTAMWNHPITESQMRALRGWHWMDVLEPVEKELACGDVGGGAMTEWGNVVAAVESELRFGSGKGRLGC